MSQIINPGDGIIFMKVGVHASEPFDKILARKTLEFEQTGMMFWGYGGGTCHPINQVRPFALEKRSQGHEILILMNEIDSNHFSFQRANEYSTDGIEWRPIPPEINVIGSRYALVLGELKPGDLDTIDLSQTSVAIGNSRGKIGADYIKGRVDKACLEYLPNPIAGKETAIKPISHIAKLKDPFAVVLR